MKACRFVRVLICALALWCVVAPPVQAGEVLGIHVLNIGELSQAEKLLRTVKNKDQWEYVTIPLTLADLQKKEDWQRFFSEARQRKFQPIVRLATRFQNGSWQVPTRKDIVDMVAFLHDLDWPQPEERIVVIANEPNHANEWGGKIDPAGYAAILDFSLDWFHSENLHYTVLSAGLDLAAGKTWQTMDEFTFLESAFYAQPQILDKLDGWTSHSYPNPAFSGRPTDVGRYSLRGYIVELNFLKKYTSRELPVYITETGWIDNKLTSRWLYTYYQYAVQNVWSDPRIRAVTPFLLQGQPGPFAGFSFLDAQGNPTKQFDAYRGVLGK